MKAGDTVTKLVCLRIATGILAGTPLAYASAASFTSAGWAIVFYDTTLTALSSQPVYSLACVDAANGVHALTYVYPGGKGVARFTIPAGYRADPAGWSIDGLTNDADTLGGYLQANQGMPTVSSTDDGDLGSVVSGDAWTSGTLNIALGKLSRFGFGFSDLAAFSISAGLKKSSSDTGIVMATPGAAFGASYLTDGAYTMGWNAMPAGMVLASGVDNQIWYIDVQLKKTSDSRIFTVASYKLNVRWDRDTVT